MRPDRWFSYDPDNRFQRHNSAEAAKAEAQRALDYAQDEAGDGWPEGTHEICWGEVREEAAEEITHKHGPDCKPAEDDDEQDECTDGYDLRFDYVSEFDLTPMAEVDTECDDLRARLTAAEAALAAAQAELAQARADRTLMTGLWLGTIPHDVLPALLPADLDSRDRLTAALDAVDLQPSAEARTAAGRAVVARIVTEQAEGQ